MKNTIEKCKNLSKKGLKVFVDFCKSNVLFLFFVLSNVLNSTLLRYLTVKNYMEYRAVIADLATVIVVGALAFFLKPKRRFAYFMTWSIIFTAACVINCLYYTNYVSFASFSMLATSLQVVDVADAVVENVLEYKDLTYLWQPIALIILHVNLKRRKKDDQLSEYDRGHLSALTLLVVGIIMFGFFFSSLTSVDFSRLGKQWNREYIVMRFGIYVYQFNDALTSIKPKISPLFGYDNAAKEFREYYEQHTNKQISNQYTDIFKGKNMIVIHAESIQNFLINAKIEDREILPNLSRLANEGLYFSNYYPQDGVGTSSDTEFTFNTSLLPSSSGAVFISYWDREYQSIPKLLSEKGYYTFSMHANKASFWNRNVMHEKLGYKKFYAYDEAFELDEMIGLGLSDKSFFRQAVPIIKENMDNNQNFMATLIMLSNHTPFTTTDPETKQTVDVSDFDVTLKYKKVDEETGEETEEIAPYLEGTKMGSYIKSAHYADEALGQFMEDLDKAGILENTVIVIYGDHDAKLKKSEFNRYYNYIPETQTLKDETYEDYVKVDFYQYELNRKVPFIIWSKNNKLHTKVDTVMGMYDAAPTLGNMFGFYNQYALGKDIFSVEENCVVFNDGNWVTDKMYYNSQKGEGYLIDPNSPVSIEYINKYNEYAEKLNLISNNIITYDLIRKTKEQTDVVENYNEDKQ